MVGDPSQWAWSSYPAVVGTAQAPEWLDSDWLLSQFGRQRKRAIKAYRQFVKEGKGLPSPLHATRHQLFLGNDSFVEQHRQDKKPEEPRELSRAYRRSLAISLDEYQARYTPNSEKRSHGPSLSVGDLHNVGDWTTFRRTLHDRQSRGSAG